MIVPAWRSPSLLLLNSLVFLLLVTPLAQGRAFAEYVVGILFLLVLLAAQHAVAGAGWHRTLAASLGFVWLVLSLWNSAESSAAAEMGSRLAFISFALFVVTMLIRRIVIAERVTFEVVCASPSVYLLLAISWAVSYQLIDSLSPGSFALARAGEELDVAGFLYFSLTTITTLGYGDITPVGPIAGIWSTLEAVTGIFFMAILVARLVSLYRR